MYFLFQGEVVYVLYQENQWVYAMTEKGMQGYVPSNYLSEIRQSVHMQPKSPKTQKKQKHKKQQVLPFDNYAIESQSMQRTDTHEHKNLSNGISKHKANTQHTATTTGRQLQDNSTQSGRQLANNTIPPALTKSLSFGEIELGDYDIFGYISDVSLEHSESEQSLDGSQASTYVESFLRRDCGKYLVLHTYHGEDENDTTVLKGRRPCII